MNRLIVVTGPWQLILVASALRQEMIEGGSLSTDCLFIQRQRRQLPQETQDTMMQIASLVWDWQSIIWNGESLDFEFKTSNFSKQRQAICHGFKKKALVDRFDQIWLCNIHHIVEKLLLELYSEAEVVIYENALASYVEYRENANANNKLLAFVNNKLLAFVNNKLLFIPRYLKFKLQEGVSTGFSFDRPYALSRAGRLEKHIKRIKTGYYFLSKKLSLPHFLDKVPIKQISKKYIIANLDTIRNTVNDFKEVEEVAKQGRNKVLVLGQCFSRLRLMSWDEELSMYKRIFSILAKNNLTPLWKEHPRVLDKPFFRALSEKIGSVQPLEVNVSFSWPIEIFSQQLDIIGCVGATSTSLFYQKELFDIPTYTFADELRSRLSDHNYSQRRYLDMVDLTISHIPKFSSDLSNFK